ncbi:hypothetical protein QQX98_008452 [Neonectria punicea]|uniref:Zn(2)-C6 fungal-type domain-containing protein n=1 Tax=Neonectria punicea TaxID=979145 RepID=A0ABR1GVI5_9HYPO
MADNRPQLGLPSIQAMTSQVEEHRRAVVKPGPRLPPKRTLVPKRKPTTVACNVCRKRKERCNGNRPSCDRCVIRVTQCSYPHVERDPFRTTPFKRSLEALQVENDQWRELYRLLHRLPEAEARQTLAQVRAVDDPVAVLKFARSSTRYLADPSPSSGPPVAPVNLRINSLDLKALSESRIRVHARPWTAVAGDGLVSELVSSFFTWDDAFFFSFIDREAFLEDMRRGDLKTAKYCSPFLVNAMCASRYFTSDRAKSMSSLGVKDLGTQFFDEAKKLLDLEGGRATLPTIQGLTLLFTMCTHLGTDRASMMYRYSACEMSSRLSLEKTFDRIKDDPLKLRHRQVISKALWGLFCYESIVAYVYLELSLIPPPKVPRCFETDERLSPTQPGNVDLFGAPYTAASTSPPFVPGIQHAVCDLSLFLYRVMRVNDRANVGSDEDLETRRGLHKELVQWRRLLPSYMKFESNLTPQTCFLRVYFDEVLVSVLRPLPPDSIFDNRSSVKDLCIHYADIDTKVVEQYIRTFSLQDYSVMVLCGLYNAVLTVVPYLDDPRTHSVFFRATLMLRWTARDFPMARFILLGAKALAWTLKAQVPAEALPHLENLGPGKDELKDIPVALALPPTEMDDVLLKV